MKKIKFIEFVIIFFISFVTTLLFTKFEYGDNISGRYCKGSVFYTNPICKEMILKNPVKSKPLISEDYYYLSIILPITKHSYEFRNPTFGYSKSLSQFGYAMSNGYFYLDMTIIFGLIMTVYFLLKNIFQKR